MTERILTACAVIVAVTFTALIVAAAYLAVFGPNF